MAKYNFEAKAVGGRDVRGEIEARTEAEARIKIRAQRLTPVKVVAVEIKAKASAAKGVRSKDLQIYTRQLSTLLSSGVPIMQALDTLGQSQRSLGLNIATKAIVDSISQGRRFGDALADHPRVFDRFFVNMVRAGEESGNLDQILNRLAQYIEKSVKIQGKIKGALVYPLVILFVAGAVVTGLLVFVIPKFQVLFSQSGSELPAMTKLVVSMSNFVIKSWYIVIIGVVGSIYGIISFYRTENGKNTIDSFLIDVPFIGDLIQKGAVARFTRTLSTLLGSGVGIMESLDIASRVVGNHVIEKAIVRAKESIAEGKSLTVPLLKEKYIPNMVTQMIGVGEQTGQLDNMLAKVADFYEDEVDVAVGALTSILEPLMMVVLGGIVAFFVVAMYLPIFSMASALG